MVQLLNWIMDWLRPHWDDKPKRWVSETHERASVLGIPPDELDAMWQMALKEADPTVVGLAPFSLMRKYMDTWEHIHTQHRL